MDAFSALKKGAIFWPFFAFFEAIFGPFVGHFLAIFGVALGRQRANRVPLGQNLNNRYIAFWARLKKLIEVKLPPPFWSN